MCGMVRCLLVDRARTGSGDPGGQHAVAAGRVFTARERSQRWCRACRVTTGSAGQWASTRALARPPRPACAVGAAGPAQAAGAGAAAAGAGQAAQAHGAAGRVAADGAVQAVPAAGAAGRPEAAGTAQPTGAAGTVESAGAA